MKRLVFLVVLVQVVVAGAASAQSLADVARREEQRRKTISTPAKVYTNKDLGPSDTPAPPVTPPAPGVATPGVPASPHPGPSAGTAAGQPPAEEPDGPSDEELRARQEEQWRTKMSDARAQLERNRMFAEALQTRANSLWADFTARDDPAQRAVIENDRKKTLAELDRVKAEIEAQTKAIADLEEEARRAGVPPGWLR